MAHALMGPKGVLTAQQPTRKSVTAHTGSGSRTGPREVLVVLGASLVRHRYPRPPRLRSPKAQALRLSWPTPFRQRDVPTTVNPRGIVAASVSRSASQARSGCAFVRGGLNRSAVGKTEAA